MRQNIRRINLTLNRKVEPEIIQHLEQQPNIRQYLIGLVRRDMGEQKAGD